MPWLLIRSMLREMTALVLLSLLGLCALFVVVLLMQVVQKVDGIGMGSLVAFIPSLAYGYLAYLLPVSVLVASAMVYGRASASGETIAAYAGTISPGVILVPALLAGLVLCVPAFIANFELGPAAYRERELLQRKAVADALSNPPPGARCLVFPDLSIAYRGVSDGVFEGVTILTKREGRVRNTLSCERARLGYNEATATITLIGAANAMLIGTAADGSLEGNPSQMSIRIMTEDLPTFQKRGRISVKADKLRALFEYAHEEITAEDDKERSTVGELVRRCLLTLAPPFFALIGALMGLVLRSRNRLIPVGGALIPAAATLFGCMALSHSLAENSRIPNWLAAGLPMLATLVPLTLLTFILYWRAHKA